MINFNFPILKNKFKNHKFLKKELLNAINEQISDSLEKQDEYYSDSIGRLDWNRKNDQSRKWIKILFKPLKDFFEDEINKLGLQGVGISALWFQQYNKNDKHGWHIHGDNFTGVYYLELDKSSPRTQIIEPVSNKLIEVEAKEGDIIIFPSVYIHRAPKVLSDKTKTIISFNFSGTYIEKKYLNEIVKLYGA